MASYQELLKLVEVVESGGSIQTQCTINIENVLGENVKLGGAGYEQLLQQIDKAAFEVQHRPKEEREHARPAAQMATPAQMAYAAAENELWHYGMAKAMP